MKCLALDTTTDVSSIAVADESGVLGEYNFAHKMDLSRRLMVNVKALLADCGLEVSDVEAVGVSLGPGSFTGLRMGVVTGKTLAQVLNVPIAGIVSLDLLARQFDYLPDAFVCPIVRVRRGEVYFAFYRTERGSVERLSDYGAGPIEDVLRLAAGAEAETGGRGGAESPHPNPLPPSGRGEAEGEGEGEGLRSAVLFCGDALPEHSEALGEALGDRFVPAPAWLCYPKAGLLARIVLGKIARGEVEDPLALVPFYIRRSPAEEKERACQPALFTRSVDNALSGLDHAQDV